jgi:FemAB-related protein (PEP-CTERM system-associated)
MTAAVACDDMLESAHRAADVRVRAFTPDDAKCWDRYVETCADATFFHRSGWRDVVENIFGHQCHYLLAERGGAICGVLPLAETKSRLFGHALTSLPFCVYGGPAADNTPATHALVDAAVAKAHALGVDYLELRNRAPVRPDWPGQDLYVTFRKTIASDVETNLKAIPRKQRAMVRKGMANALRSEVDSGAGRFFDLYADNVHRHGTPALSRRYFDTLQRVFGEACEVLIVVDREARPVSGVLSFYFRDEVLPYYAGDSQAARSVAANDFKYWELMRRACERGVRVFDYGRSKRGTGSFDFKRNWGFEPAQLSYEYRLLRRASVPQNNPLNPRYRAFIAMWRRLPRRAANMLGPHIVRHLG